MHGNDFDLIQKRVMERMKELSSNLTYHDIEHTLDVVEHTARIAADEGVNDKEKYLLKVAALYHDTGFLETYFGHEEKSSELFLKDTEQFRSFNDSDKKIIHDLIMATKMPQEPKNLLQKIICDADLDYLGRSDFHDISQKLKREFINYNITNENGWHDLQLHFLQNHRYHTNSSKLLRQPVKNANIAKL